MGKELHTILNYGFYVMSTTLIKPVDSNRVYSLFHLYDWTEKDLWFVYSACKIGVYFLWLCVLMWHKPCLQGRQGDARLDCVK